MVGSIDHTMADDLDSYVDQRVPAELIRDAVSQGTAIEIHGVYPSHFELVAHELGLLPQKSLGSHQLMGKILNGVRPEVFEVVDPYGKQLLCFAVPPGHDYVTHYASLVAHVVNRYTRRIDRHLQVWRYPVAEQEIADWTGLDKTVTNDADLIVFGKVELMDEVLIHAGYECSDHCSTEYYDSTTFRCPGARQVTLLGVRFSYWGSIGARLAQRCCALGAKEIIYIGKLGTLRKPEEIYNRLYVPSRYGLLTGLRLQQVSAGPPNGLLARLPSLDSGLHVSVPTVLEEDQSQRELARLLGASTMDNELAQMALAIHDWNVEHDTSVCFSGLHYATDYLRAKNELGTDIEFSLARGRTLAARRRRSRAELSISDCLIDYFRNSQMEAA